MVGDVLETRVETRFDLPDFDRGFRDADEFLENVDEELWTRTEQWSVLLRPSGYADGDLRVVLSWNGYLLHLRLDGGGRLTRNAILPDLRDAVGRYHRPPARTRLVSVFSGLASVVIIVLGVWVQWTLIGRLVEAEWDLVPTLLVTVPLVMLMGVLAVVVGDGPVRLYRDKRPGVELLPDDNTSRWDRERKRLNQQVIVIAALAGIVSAIVAIAAFL